MRKIIASVLIALSLASCTSAQLSTLQTQTAQFIQDVQKTASVTCGVIPEVAAIVSIFNAAVGATVATVSAAVCAAVPPVASARYGAIQRYGAGPASYIGTTSVGTSTVVVTGWRTH